MQHPSPPVGNGCTFSCLTDSVQILESHLFLKRSPSSKFSFSFFPQLLSKPKFSVLEKIKTIGSTYMVAAGLQPGKEGERAVSLVEVCVRAGERKMCYRVVLHRVTQKEARPCEQSFDSTASKGTKPKPFGRDAHVRRPTRRHMRRGDPLCLVGFEPMERTKAARRRPFRPSPAGAAASFAA